MGKGANYVNNNRGVHLQANKKKTGDNMPMCQYGAGCSRASCIYRHPARTGVPLQQSKEPCMAFLAGLCAFDGKGCRKRHPPKHEIDRLISKYKKTRCRFGDECKTNGCLYMHPSDVVEEIGQDNVAWDNQCQFVPPASSGATMYQQAARNSMQPAHQPYYPQPTDRHQQLEPPHNMALATMNNAPKFVPGQPFVIQGQRAQEQQFTPSPSARAFVPKASSQEFVPGQYKSS